jgi:Protein of unknown function (DUF4232)
MKRYAGAIAVAGLITCLAACAGASTSATVTAPSSQAVGTSPAPSSPAASTSAPPVAARAPASHVTTTSGSAPSSAAASTPAAGDPPPACEGGLGLGVWVAVSQANGAAGTTYYPLEFTNTSMVTCELFGYPGVSAVNGSGQQLGSPAARGSSADDKAVILAPGATAHTILAYHQTAVSTEMGCDPVSTTAELRIYPPDQTLPTYAEFSLPACSGTGVIYLSLTEPIVAGVGTINS